MYGFFKIPISSSPLEKKEYRKYMCALCDSLHENYGIKGRIFTNYDSTTLALLIGALDESLNKEISDPPRYLCLRTLKHKKAPDMFRFVSAISIMIAYSKFLDEANENSKKVPKWIMKYSDLASKHLSRYDLNKSFFENRLQEQHRLEKECTDIEILSNPSSEIISRIFNVIGELTSETKFSASLKELGFELGKLVYIYDGLLDYQNDSKTGTFNCISACYFMQGKDMQSISTEIFDFIEITKNNISSILKRIEFNHNTSLIRRVLLQDFEISTIKHKKGVVSELKRTKSYCTAFSRNRLTKQAIYGILTGALAVQPVAASNFMKSDLGGDLCDALVCCGGCCCAIICTCIIDGGGGGTTNTNGRDGGGPGW